MNCICLQLNHLMNQSTDGRDSTSTGIAELIKLDAFIASEKLDSMNPLLVEKFNRGQRNIIRTQHVEDFMNQGNLGSISTPIVSKPS